MDVLCAVYTTQRGGMARLNVARQAGRPSRLTLSTTFATPPHLLVLRNAAWLCTTFLPLTRSAATSSSLPQLASTARSLRNAPSLCGAHIIEHPPTNLVAVGDAA